MALRRGLQRVLLLVGIGVARERLVYRAMREDRDGLPELGTSSRYLGVRGEYDIPIDGDGFVQPGDGGMSVSPETPLNISEDRRPRDLGGHGKDPAWGLDLRFLARELKYAPDSDDPKHGYLEPASRMSYDKYEKTIAETRQYWALYKRDDLNRAE